jgi:hypothetical protein
MANGADVDQQMDAWDRTLYTFADAHGHEAVCDIL